MSTFYTISSSNNALFNGGSEANSNSINILLYGLISANAVNQNQNFLSDFKQLETQYPQINVRINSGGGDVFTGIAIYNALKNSPATIHVFIDGIAASIASVIALAGDKIFMSRYAQLMVHKVSGNIQGDSEKLREAASLMDEVETSLLSIYTEKTGLEPDHIRNQWLQRGKDSWFNATSALKNKLIDEIFDGIVTKAPKGISNSLEVWNFYDSQLQNTLNNSDMELKNALINALGLEANASETDVINAFSIHAKVITDLKSDNEGLKVQVTDFQNQLAASHKQKVKDLIDNAVHSHRITEEQRPNYIILAEANYEATKTVINGLTPYKSISSQLVTDDPQAEYKTFKEYQEKDPAALAAMKENNPTKFTALFKKEFGTNPKLIN
ncbi:MAG: head maturation protease, ClpP-related [Bacteroidia bacterium]